MIRAGLAIYSGPMHSRTLGPLRSEAPKTLMCEASRAPRYRDTEGVWAGEDRDWVSSSPAN